LLVFARQAGASHDHARGAKTTLKSLGIEKSLLHGMEMAVRRQPFDGCYFALGNPEGGHETTVNRLSVNPYGAGAAVSMVATFFRAQPAKVAHECSQALAWPRIGSE
jgi:hypothetical protein